MGNMCLLTADTAAGVAPFIGVVLVILVLVIILTSCVKIVPVSYTHLTLPTIRLV